MVETLDEILRKALQCHGSDVFIVPGSPIMTKVNGKIFPISEQKVFPNDIALLEDRAYELAGRDRDTLHEEGDDDPEIDYNLNFTFNKAQKRTVRAGLSNTFGFGGHNACVVFKKYE